MFLVIYLAHTLPPQTMETKRLSLNKFSKTKNQLMQNRTQVKLLKKLYKLWLRRRMKLRRQKMSHM